MNFTFLVSCDQKYYDNWATNLLKSIRYFNNHNNYNLHCHIVNPTENIQKIDKVKYTFENKNFLDKPREIAYLQCSRFLTVNKYYPNNEIVITLDADSICTREFSKDEIENLISHNHVLTRGKPNDNRWLAGMIVFKDQKFKKDYNDMILSKEDQHWEYGWDQIVLDQLSEKHQFKQLPDEWISIGKNGPKRVFLTLKGPSQKTEEKYLNSYLNLVKKINEDKK